jgi:hypothetical protein
MLKVRSDVPSIETTALLPVHPVPHLHRRPPAFGKDPNQQHAEIISQHVAATHNRLGLAPAEVEQLRLKHRGGG